MPKTSLDIRIARALGLVGDQGIPGGGDGYPLRNAPSPLKVFAPFVAARSERRQRRLAATSSSDHKAGGQRLVLRADGQWRDTGLMLKVGDRVALAASGRLFLSRALEVSVGAGTCLWYRIGDGPIARLRSASETLVADRAGALRLQAALPGAFGSPMGELNAESPPPPMSGELLVSIDPLANDADSVEGTPAGWCYLWRLGDASIFSHDKKDESLCCDTHGDVGILQYPVDVALTEQLRLDWQWWVDELPSSLPEHIQPTHDYLSIAVEFDNGLDLTYMWSSSLAEGTIFQCPLPWWDKRETHWVLRTPAHGLKQWLSESRELLADYRRAIGGVPPKRVKGIWLIANSVFQGGRGRCRYKGIQLRSQGEWAVDALYGEK